MTKTTKRAAIYVRVSSEEQVQGYSLDAQERAARDYCQFHGWDVVHVYRDEGRSARTDAIAKRPGFLAMLEEGEAGKFDVLIVHKLDRFARYLRVQLDGYERLTKAGIGFVSMNENIDFSTPMDRMIMSQMGAYNQFYSDNLSEETKKGKQERKAQGIYNGLLPFRVTKNNVGIPILDTEPRYCDIATRSEISTGDGLILAFELARTGKTDREIAQALNAAGYRTTGNRGSSPFQKDSVRVMLKNRFYVGDLPDGHGGWIPGRHGALIDPDLFEQAQTARLRNTHRPRRVASVRSPWSLSRLAVCAACGKPVTADGNHRARCQGRTQGNGCDQPSFYQSLIDDQLSGVLSTFDVSGDQRSRLIEIWRRSQHQHADTGTTRQRVQSKLDRLKLLFLEGDLTTEDYRARKDGLTAELASLPPVGNQGDAVGARLASYLIDMSRAWKDATPEERNKLARAMFSSVLVENKQAMACVPRPELEPFFRTLAVNPNTESCNGGSDGLRCHARTLRPRVVVVAIPPERRRVGSSGRAPYSKQRPTRLSPEDRAMILARGKSATLRELADEFGVSHETIRSVLCARELTTIPPVPEN